MFNSPRPAQRYGGNSANGFGGSFVDENPLASSAYDGLDPWSAAPSPSATPAPQTSSVFSSVIADATVPTIYNRAFALVDPSNSGETSVGSLSRILSTSALPAATIEKIVNLVSNRSRVSKLEFFVALALVALAQSGKDVSIEQVAALSSQNELPEPTLNLDALPPSTSTFMPNTTTPSTIRSPAPAYAADGPPAPTYSADDPWNTSTRFVSPPSNLGSGFDAPPRSAPNPPSALAGPGLPKDWWKKQDTISVAIQGQQGFILNRYTVYQITTDKGAPVTRRYSEFVYLWDCLVRRYPFRLFPALPPKRIGPDEYFLEQRRRGLARFLNFVLNHPVIKEDGILAVFLTHHSFEEWRKATTVSLDEESSSKRVDRIEEMSIPSDLDDKIATIRRRINPLIEQWQRICILAERIIKRREAAAVRINTSPLRHLPAHLLTPLFSPVKQSSPFSDTASTNTLTSAFGFAPIDEQSDLSRLTNTLRSVIEVTDPCWRADECELSMGVRTGLGHVASHCQRQSELAEQRTRALFDTTLEALKAQRDLYIATRDLFIRNDRLSLDQVERLKKRVETTSVKLDGIKAAQKEGWQDEADRLSSSIEKDQATIAAQLSRRVFIRACLWSELRIILHNRENTCLSALIQQFAREEQSYAEATANTWTSLGEAVEDMPYE
ncbi:Sorting nexin mvp1 [Marasmius sp. AFHP31]|nr:Sorting nexin mvp1 [Marasmius sp. AFHP31]